MNFVNYVIELDCGKSGRYQGLVTKIAGEEITLTNCTLNGQPVNFYEISFHRSRIQQLRIIRIPDDDVIVSAHKVRNFQPPPDPQHLPPPRFTETKSPNSASSPQFSSSSSSATSSAEAASSSASSCVDEIITVRNRIPTEPEKQQEKEEELENNSSHVASSSQSLTSCSLECEFPLNSKLIARIRSCHASYLAEQATKQQNAHSPSLLDKSKSASLSASPPPPDIIRQLVSCASRNNASDNPQQQGGGKEERKVETEPKGDVITTTRSEWFVQSHLTRPPSNLPIRVPHVELATLNALLDCAIPDPSHSCKSLSAAAFPIARQAELFAQSVMQHLLLTTSSSASTSSVTSSSPFSPHFSSLLTHSHTHTQPEYKLGRVLLLASSNEASGSLLLALARHLIYAEIAASLCIGIHGDDVISSLTKTTTTTTADQSHHPHHHHHHRPHLTNQERAFAAEHRSLNDAIRWANQSSARSARSTNWHRVFIGQQSDALLARVRSYFTTLRNLTGCAVPDLVIASAFSASSFSFSSSSGDECKEDVSDWPNDWLGFQDWLASKCAPAGVRVIAVNPARLSLLSWNEAIFAPLPAFPPASYKVLRHHSKSSQRANTAHKKHKFVRVINHPLTKFYMCSLGIPRYLFEKRGVAFEQHTLQSGGGGQLVSLIAR